MSKFFSAYSSESESESSDNEEVPKPRAAQTQPGRVFQFSDEEDDTKRIVRSQKDKRYDELQTSIKQMRNSMKIKDIAKVQTEWENLCKVYVKSKNVVDKEGIPHFYVKSLMELEDFIKEQWENTEGRKKLSKVNAKALASVKQKLRKYNRDYESQISDCRENPDRYEEEEVDEDDEEEEKVESESDDELPAPAEEKIKINKFLKAGGSETDSDDSLMGGDTDSSDDDDFPTGGVLTAEMFLKKDDKDQKVGKKAEKQAEKILASKKRAPKIQPDDDEGGWTEVKGSALQEKTRQLFPKDTEINHQVVLKKMQEILAQRGKKSTDRAYLIDYFKELRTIAEKHNLGPALSLKIIFSIIAAIFDSTTSTDAALKYEIWRSCLDHVTEMIELLEEHTDIYVSANVSDDSENVENADEPLRIKGCVLTTVERMNDEFTKLLQHSDCHSTEYVDRLKDELIVTDIIVRLQKRLEKTGISDEISRIYMLRVEHIYYKLDMKDLQGIKAQMEENETKEQKVDKEQKEETPVEDGTTVTKEETPVENGVVIENDAEIENDSGIENEPGIENGPGIEKEIEANENDVACTKHDDAAIIDLLCKYIYAKAPDRIRTRAMLCHIYHHALHDRWFEARDMILISHLQETIQHSDIATQILYNRTMVQLGLCAFRHGMINDAHNALHDLQATGRAKELLAQGLMNLKNTERTPEQEKIEKRRLMPFHMHINLELLECVYLTSAMLMEIPYMAAHEFDHRRKIISKSFHYQMRQSDKQPLVGPPESMREHVVAAAKAMKTGDWKQCSIFVLAIKCWNLFSKSGNVKTMLERKIKEESLRTYLFTYNKIYDSISMLGLAEMFDLPHPVVHSIISKMIINEELQASWDEPTQTLVLHHDAEPTLLQSMGMQLAEKIGNLVDHHERILDFKQGGFFTKGGGKGQYQQGGKGNYQGGKGNYQGGKGNYQGGKGNYQGGNYQGGNYQGGNYQGGNYQGGNYQGGNYQGGRGNYQGGRGNYQGGKGNYQQGRQYQQQVRFRPQR